MKTILLIIVALSYLCLSAGFAQDNFKIPKKLDVTPATYLEELWVKDTNRKLPDREKESICRLLIWAYQTSKKRYNQDYNIGLNTPVYKLFKANFSDISKAEREVIFLSAIYNYILASPELQTLLNQKKSRTK